jgi:2-C-methyl-D-erythritol 4-phosphate cytidylyltransferase
MSSRYFGLVPAAGGGTRFGASARKSAPKQYAAINGAPMLRHAVAALAAAPEIDTVFVVLAPGDEMFRTIDWSEFGPRVEPLYCGGAKRSDSVLNGLVALAPLLEPDDWVLVHDAARPCLARADLAHLIDEVTASGTGGILAVRVSDTLKRSDDGDTIAGTEPRERLWQAQTPQMFRYGLLLRALRDAPQVTDESAAVEAAGFSPRLVEGSHRNFKVTYASDLELAALILQSARG